MKFDLCKLRAGHGGSSWLSLLLTLCAANCYAANPPLPYPLEFTPGTPSETLLLRKNSGTTLDRSVRHFDPGQFCLYGVPALPGTECRLELELENPSPEGLPTVTVQGSSSQALPIRMEPMATGGLSIVWTAPADSRVGSFCSVLISAQHGALSVKRLRMFHQERDSHSDGIPDALVEWLRAGLPAGIQPVRIRPPDAPFTAAATDQVPLPEEESLADVILLNSGSKDTFSTWADRGKTIWAQLPAYIPPAVALPPSERMQTGADGRMVRDSAGYFPSPFPSQTLEKIKDVEAALAAHAAGICLTDPGYWAKAGYEPGFRQIWQTRLRDTWQDPARSIDNRYRASELMAALTAEEVQSVLQAGEQNNPLCRRIVALRSSIASARNGRISPVWQIDAQPAVTDVIALMSDAELEDPVRNNGLRRAQPFARAYMGFSSLRNVTRDRDRRLWLSLDAEALTSDNRALASLSRGRLEQAVTAALLTEGAENFVLPSIQQAGKDAAIATEFNSLSAALESMHAQPPQTLIPMSDIGVLLSDTLQWQQGGPEPGDVEECCSLALPLLQQGIAIQMASLERSVDPGYLSHFKTLLLSYDSQKSLSARTQQALAAWVRRGGSLLFFGGFDRYNEAASSWWRRAGLYAPQTDLWNQLNLKLTGAPAIKKSATQDLSQYMLLTPTTASSGLHTVEVDLSRYAHQAGGCAVRFTARPGGSAALRAAELRVGGRLAASFITGSDLESRFLIYDDHSQFSQDARSVSGSAAWTYQFDNLPKDDSTLLTLQIEGSLKVEAAPALSDASRTLQATSQAPGLADQFPRLRLGVSYPITLYPLPAAAFTQPPQLTARSHAPKAARNEDSLPIPLYTLRSGGTPIWMQNVEHGLIIHIGVAPGFFTSSARSAGLLRALTRLAYQRAGGIYREPGFLRAKRGRYTIVQTFHASRIVEGRTVDLFSPTLDVALNRVVPPNSSALLYTLDSTSARPHIGFVSGRTQAQLETETVTAYVVAGPRASPGVARIDRAGRQPMAVHGLDRLGRSVIIEKSVEGGTLLLHYPNDPDGIAVRIDWKK